MKIHVSRRSHVALVLSLILVASATCFAQAPRPLTVRDFSTWRDIVTPTLSPDGHYLAFIAHFDQSDDRGQAVILNTGGEKVAASPIYSSAQGLAWTPSGDEISEAIRARKALRSLWRHGDVGRLEALERKSLTSFSFGSSGFVLRHVLADHLVLGRPKRHQRPRQPRRHLRRLREIHDRQCPHDLRELGVRGELLPQQSEPRFAGRFR